MSGAEMARIVKRDEIAGAGLQVRMLRDALAAQTAPAAQPVVETPVRDEDTDSTTERARHLVQAMLSGFAQQRRNLLAELQPYVVRVALEVARRIVRRELNSDPGMVTRTVQAALEQMVAASHVTVRVHPLDAQLLQSHIREITSAPDQAEAIDIVPDGSIEQGGCLVESDRGIVDARLRTQFEEMQTQLLRELE